MTAHTTAPGVELPLPLLFEAPVLADFAERAEAARQQVEAEGALNGGGPVLRLTSASGTIYLKRQR